MTGRGLVLADIDTSVDVFHPDFFAADGGAFDWIDVNGNGCFDPGVDAVDLDRDGMADEDERAGVLRAEARDMAYFEILPVRPAGFSAVHDWVYTDTNGNGLRDFGPAAGFDDLSPAFGEPLFVADDVDGDGTLDRSERVLRLSTSRIRAIYVGYTDRDPHVYRRGADLTDLPDAPFGSGMYGMPESMHATAVVSIAAGGVPGLGRPLTGLAPEAELLVVYDGAWDIVSSVMWVIGEGADVVLHEYAPWTTVSLDGSDPLSEIINDSTADEGMVHVCPVGNTGGSRKHTMADLAAGASVSLSLDVPNMGISYLGISFHWRPGVGGVRVEAVLPSGSRHDLTRDGGLSLDGLDSWVSSDTTAGGTRMIHLQGTGTVPVGSWRFEITGNPGREITIHGFVQDEVSGWGEGAAWAPSIASDVSNIGLPSVADSCLAVGAYTGHAYSDDAWWFYGEEAASAIRGYSGRGPRIDGLQKPDLVAPDNPIASFPRWVEQEAGLGSYSIFGGTSGAGPHVAGAALLLLGVTPEGGHAVLDLLIRGAVSDSQTGPVPNFDYGYGRVDLWEPLGVSPGGARPTLNLEAPSWVYPGEPLVVHPDVGDADGDPTLLEIRWDVGYDGEWDGPFGALSDISHVAIEEGRLGIKAVVRDASGLTDRDVTWVVVSSTGAPDGDADSDADGDSDGLRDGGDGVDSGPSSELPSTMSGGCSCRAGGSPSWRRPARLVFLVLF